MCSWKWIDKNYFTIFVAILALLVGLGLAIEWDITLAGNWDVSFSAELETEKSLWDIVSSLGSLLSGIGAILIIVIGVTKGNEWAKSIKYTKRLDLLFTSLNSLLVATNVANEFFDIHFTKEKMRDEAIRQSAKLDTYLEEDLDRTKLIKCLSNDFRKLKSDREKYAQSYKEKLKEVSTLSELCSNLIIDDGAGKKALKKIKAIVLTLNDEVDEYISSNAGWKEVVIRNMNLSVSHLKISVEEAINSAVVDLSK